MLFELAHRIGTGISQILILDIVWLGRVHTRDIAELDHLHDEDLNRFRKQFDAQVSVM